LDKGQHNQVYNIGSGEELRNIDIFRRIAAILGVPEEKAWTAVADRSGQDIRYSLDDSKLKALGWSPKRRLNQELEAIVQSLDSSRFV
jgi:dTDP-D-glucose 4,6-dehydratase